MNQNIIVTTTIYPLRAAIKKFATIKGWDLLIVGDKKTPHEQYISFSKLKSHCTYLSPDEQDKRYRKISNAIGWNSIQRRNIGFIYAYEMGYELIASLDDDNEPLENWGKDIFINSSTPVDFYEVDSIAFDPLSPFKNKEIWHRGFPLELLENRFKFARSHKKVTPLVQANLWNGDPDIDAMSRISFKPEVKFPNSINPYSSSSLMPFNSQNTILSREVIPFYFVLPFIGRMDDIWAAYIFQNYFSDKIVFAEATVFQNRNEQSLITNLENEIFGYRNTLDLLNDLKNYRRYLPQNTLSALTEYRSNFDEWT